MDTCESVFVNVLNVCNIRHDVKLAPVVRVRDWQSQGRRFDSGKTPKTPTVTIQIYKDLS